MIFAEVASRVGLLGKVNLPREPGEPARVERRKRKGVEKGATLCQRAAPARKSPTKLRRCLSPSRTLPPLREIGEFPPLRVLSLRSSRDRFDTDGWNRSGPASRAISVRSSLRKFRCSFLQRRWKVRRDSTISVSAVVKILLS